MKKKLFCLLILCLNIAYPITPFSTIHIGIRNETGKPVKINDFLWFFHTRRGGYMWESHAGIFQGITLNAKPPADHALPQKEISLNISKIMGVSDYDSSTLWSLKSITISGKNYVSNRVKKCSVFNSDFIKSYFDHKPAVMIVLKNNGEGYYRAKYVYEIHPLVSSSCYTNMTLENEDTAWQ
jgi:hypothetical protein